MTPLEDFGFAKLGTVRGRRVVMGFSILMTVICLLLWIVAIAGYGVVSSYSFLNNFLYNSWSEETSTAERSAWVGSIFCK